MPAVAVEKAEAVLAADPNVVAAWAFGSAKDGCVGPDSDLDIGVFFRRKPGLDDLTDLLLKLQGALQFGDIDLVVLNGASSLLRFEAVSGRPIYCRDASERAAFVSLAAREYEDDMAFFQRGMRWRAEACRPGICEGLVDADAGRVRPLGNVDAELRKKYGIPQDTRERADEPPR